MSFVLVPGAGGAGWYWHLVEADLRQRGHDVVSADLPAGGDSGPEQYLDATIAAAADRTDITLVGQSMGGFTLALAADRLPVSQLVFVNAMIPIPGESPGGWWEATGHSEAMRQNDLAAGRTTEFDLATHFMHDVPADLAEEITHHGGEDSGAYFSAPCRFSGWPDVPMRALAGRDDRLFPVDFQRRVARDRLGVELDEIGGGHLVALANPVETAERLAAYRVEDLGH